MKYYLAVDIGASSGRLILGHRDAGKKASDDTGLSAFPVEWSESNGVY